HCHPRSRHAKLIATTAPQTFCFDHRSTMCCTYFAACTYTGQERLLKGAQSPIYLSPHAAAACRMCYLPGLDSPQCPKTRCTMYNLLGQSALHDSHCDSEYVSRAEQCSGALLPYPAMCHLCEVHSGWLLHQRCWGDQIVFLECADAMHDSAMAPTLLGHVLQET